MGEADSADLIGTWPEGNGSVRLFRPSIRLRFRTGLKHIEVLIVPYNTGDLCSLEFIQEMT